jgi:cytoskeletal protein CcmA (bactofilin family)
MFAVLTTAGLALPVWAAPNFMAGDRNHPVTINNPLGDDTYIGADTAMVSSDINGDLIIGANTAQINGRIAGDLWVGAGTVTVNNRVAGDVRIGAGEAVINGVVDDDVIVGSGKLTIGEKAIIKGDLVVGSGSVVVYGKIYGNARIAGGAVTLKANINGDVMVKTDNHLTILPGTKIGGELSYWAPTENPDFSKFALAVKYHPAARRSRAPMISAFMWMVPAVTLGLLLWKFVCLFLLGTILIWLMPKLLPRVVAVIKKDYWKVFWQGLIFIIGAPALLLVLALTIVGLPLAFVGGLLYILALLIGGIAAAALVGSWLIKKSDKTVRRQLGALAAGLVVLELLVIIPLVGCLAIWVLMVIGVGGLWQDRYKMFKAGKY